MNRYNYLTEDHENKYVRYMYNVLDVVVKNKDYFESRPKELAFIMWQYDKLSNKANEESYWGNLKHPVMEIEETVGKEYADKVYSAWSATVSNSMEVINYSNLECKQNKTIKDYYKIKLAEGYRYKSFYHSERDVDNQLLCVIGNRYMWNDDGYIVEGRHEEDGTIYYNYHKVQKQIDIYIKDQILLFKDKSAMDAVEKARKECLADYQKYSLNTEWEKQDEEFKKLLIKTIPLANKENKLTEEELNKLNMEELLVLAEGTLTHEEKEKRKKKQEQQKRKELEFKSKYYPMSERYSLLTNMPENVHKSYIEAGMKISLRIIFNPIEDDNNKKIAIKFIEKWKDNVKSYYNKYKDNPLELWKDNDYIVSLIEDNSD